MSRETQPYKRSFSASVGAGLGSLIGGSGKQYYILEHKINSKFHKIGEVQEIIVDNIELGRDVKCQVRFDDSFQTVSRQHAAIVKQSDNWKLVHLSKTNHTLLNGKEVGKEWVLQNGDDIQLSIGGPRLGFIVPTGNKVTVDSIGLSRRLSLFRQQALRPYKTVLSMISCLLMFVILVMFFMKQNITSLANENKVILAQLDKAADKNKQMQEEHEKALNELRKEYETLKKEAEKARKDAEAARREAELAKEGIDAAKKESEAARIEAEAARIEAEAARIEAVLQNKPSEDIQSLIEKCKDDVYYLDVEKVYLTDGEKTKVVTMRNRIPYEWTGTGFLLNDGRFVTARHCVQGWRFESFKRERKLLMQVAESDSRENVKIVAIIKATNRTGNKFSFKSTDFKFSDVYDRKEKIGKKSGNPLYLKSAYFATDVRLWSTDWVYVNTSSRGTLTADFALSNNLLTGTDLHVLGFPGTIGVEDTPSIINPIYNKFSVSMDGLDNSGCFLHTRGTDFGNSGGPIFARKGNELVVIGIVSRGSSRSEEYNYGVPISAIQ